MSKHITKNGRVSDLFFWVIWQHLFFLFFFFFMRGLLLNFIEFFLAVTCAKIINMLIILYHFKSLRILGILLFSCCF